MDFKPDKYKQAILDFITDGEGSGIVKAVAGSGKTTTIVAAAELISTDAYAIFLAFNKSIADELRSRLPKHVQARTFHSVGMAAWGTFAKSRPRVDSDKVYKIMKGITGNLKKEDPRNFVFAQAKRLVGLAKNAGLVPNGSDCEHGLMNDSDNSWRSLADHHDITCDDFPAAIQLARETLLTSIEISEESIDFDDMLYMPLITGAPFFKNDWVFVDEAQDVSATQRAMLARMLKPGGRLIAVGDPHQAIYGFRGADSESMNQITKRFDCKEFPLSTSYRCPRLIVEEAQNYVSHIESSPDAPEGKFERLSEWGPSTIKPGAGILCRNVAPLLVVAFRLIAAGVPVKMLGREIGKGLVTLIKSQRAGDSVPRLMVKLAEYGDKEIERHLAKGKEELAAAVEDKVECVRVIAESAGVKTVRALISRIESLFDSTKPGVELATVHKAKGLEWEQVYILDRATKMPSPWARRAWQKQQETNLIYVAITRSQGELYDIETDGWKA